MPAPRYTRGIVAALTLLAIAVTTPAHAGRPAETWLTDPAGDTTNALGLQESHPRTDIISVQVADSREALVFTLHLLDANAHPKDVFGEDDTSGHQSYSLSARLRNAHFYLGAVDEYHQPTFPVGVVWGGNESSCTGAGEGALDKAASTVTLTVPLSIFDNCVFGRPRGGDVLAFPYVTTQDGGLLGYTDYAQSDAEYTIGR